MTTVILFSIGYSLRIIFTILQMASVVNVQSIGEFPAVQLECCLSLLCDMPPLYYFVYQHIVNLTDEQEASRVEME